MKSCFGYVRVSSQKQGEGVSLDAQKDAILRFASAHQLTIVRWFEEQQTAAKSGRPLFNAMLKALEAGEANGVVMHRIDRSARNFFDWAKIGELADRGIDVHFATESLDFRSRGGRLTANIQMAVAEDYVRNLRAEIHKGQRGQLERGYYPFSAPIGYRNNGRNALKTIDPVKGPLVRQAFELYASGQFSLHSLREELARRGLAKPSGQPLSKGCLEKFLANPFYAGIIRIRKTGEVFKGAHEPLISTRLFAHVENVRAGKCGKKVTRHNHLFRGLFRCGHCSRSMIPERQKGHVYYRCQYRMCHTNSIREDALGTAIENVLAGAAFPADCLVALTQRFEKWVQQSSSEITAQNHKLQLAKLDDRLEKLEDAAIDQIIDASGFQRRKIKLLAERAALEETARDQARLHDSPAILRRFLERLKNLAEHYHFADTAGKREIVEIAVSNRTVKDKKVLVEPSDWLKATKDAVAVLSCADARSTSRTEHSKELQGQHLMQLCELARSSYAVKLKELFEDQCRESGAGGQDMQRMARGP